MKIPRIVNMERSGCINRVFKPDSHRQDLNRNREGVPRRGCRDAAGFSSLGFRIRSSLSILTITKTNNTSGSLSNLLLVGHHHNGDTLLIEIIEQVKNLRCGRGIQITGGFVSKNELGLID